MFTKIKKSNYFKAISVILSICIFFQSSVMAGDKVTLNAGTPIVLETLKVIKSDAVSVGEVIDLRVKFDVKVGESVVIKAGSIAQGQVIKAQKAKGLGKPGQLEIQVNTIQTIDGQVIPLAGGNISREGEDKTTEAVVLGIILCILFLTIKGKNAEVPMYTQINAAAAGTTYIEVNN
jgi:sporulation protein YlmC with PRC-barrel domain